MNYFNVFSNIHSPCLGCERRRVLCRSVCREFAEYREKVEAVGRARRSNDDIIAYSQATHLVLEKRYGKK